MASLFTKTPDAEYIQVRGSRVSRGPKVGSGKGVGSSHSYSKIRYAGGNPYICHYKQLVLMLRIPKVRVTGWVWGIYPQRDEGHNQKQTHEENFRISQSRGFTLTCLTQSSNNP